MLSTLLSASGCRTGAYTSPHLIRYNERIAVDGQPVSDGEIIHAFEQIEAAREDVPLTYFEFGTLAALLVFRARDVEVAVFEVGLGGRLDAVNAIDPDAALITSIALDHQAWLGDTREAIARELCTTPEGMHKGSAGPWATALCEHAGRVLRRNCFTFDHARPFG